MQVLRLYEGQRRERQRFLSARASISKQSTLLALGL